MALKIENPQAEELAHRLAALTGRTVTDAVVFALLEQVRRETGRERMSHLREQLRAISDRCAALPDLDVRPVDEILGYDEHGIPG